MEGELIDLLCSPLTYVPFQKVPMNVERETVVFLGLTSALLCLLLSGV